MREEVDRFDGLAETYELHRPGYPVQAFQALLADLRCPAKVALDVGAGPGNSTASLRQACGPEWRYIAIEPGRDMRRVLSRRFAAAPDVQVLDATAEDMRVPSGVAGMVLACTAFHWFDARQFFAESARVLAPGGILAIARNRRRPQPVLQVFDRYIEKHSAETTDLTRREVTKEPVLRCLAGLPAFMAARSHTYPWTSQLAARGLIDLYLTRSTLWGVVRRIGLSQVMADLTTICADLGLGDGPIRVEWETTVKWARKRGD